MTQIRYCRLENSKKGKKYVCCEDYVYYSERYNRYITVPKGMESDGATFARDLPTDAWFIHDKICDTGLWDDGTPIDNWIASTVLGDVLWDDGMRIESVLWWWATWLFGGGEARKNGMRRVYGKTSRYSEQVQR